MVRCGVCSVSKVLPASGGAAAKCSAVQCSAGWGAVVQSAARRSSVRWCSDAPYDASRVTEATRASRRDCSSMQNSAHRRAISHFGASRTLDSSGRIWRPRACAICRASRVKKCYRLQRRRVDCTTGDERWTWFNIAHACCGGADTWKALLWSMKSGAPPG